MRIKCCLKRTSIFQSVFIGQRVLFSYSAINFLFFFGSNFRFSVSPHTFTVPSLWSSTTYLPPCGVGSSTHFTASCFVSLPSCCPWEPASLWLSPTSSCRVKIIGGGGEVSWVQDPLVSSYLSTHFSTIGIDQAWVGWCRAWSSLAIPYSLHSSSPSCSGLFHSGPHWYLSVISIAAWRWTKEC